MGTGKVLQRSVNSWDMHQLALPLHVSFRVLCFWARALYLTSNTSPFFCTNTRAEKLLYLVNGLLHTHPARHLGDGSKNSPFETRVSKRTAAGVRQMDNGQFSSVF